MEMQQKPSNKTPAARIISRFGAKSIAAWTGRHQSRVHAWSWPTSRGGTGGVVPVRLRPAIIRGALSDFQTVLTPADFEPAGDETYVFDKEAA
jgi:hypothetical protein